MSSSSSYAVGGKTLRHRNVPSLDESPNRGEESMDAVQEYQRTNGDTKQKPNTNINWPLIHVYVTIPMVFFGAALFTRLYKIGASDFVVWDEAHFGKFASHYLKREFYFDVHPPLGKMLNGLAGYLAGYDGTFEFDSGSKYPEGLNYVFMRVVNGVFGALCVPLAYWTALDFEFSALSACLVASMVLFDNSFATISRFILLDSMLLFFTASTACCLGRFHRYRRVPFTFRWYKWLILTGVNVGCVCSVKWVGILVTVVVGLYTVDDLWFKLGDLSISRKSYAMHWVTRIFGFIVVPIGIYCLNFWIHFRILENSGPGDAQMSSLFQANLKGTDLANSPLEIVIGSKATLKNMGYGGGLLHSHVQTFPEGSQQQQITCYHHKDPNNDWFFYPNRYDRDYDVDSPELRYIGHGDTIRLIHAMTGRNLHSHEIPAPITKEQWEVSGYGNLTIGDEKDHWVVEVVDDIYSRDHSRIRTLTTVMRFRHPVLGCYLRAANVNLPQWGWRQIEVTCDPQNNPKDKFTHWNVETHINEKLPTSDAKVYRTSFWRDLVHLNVAMMTSNNALIPDPDKFDALASQPWQWPLASISLRMCGWSDETIKYLMVGNPFVYYLSFGSLVMFSGIVLFYLIRWQRHYRDFTPVQLDKIHYGGLYSAIAWVMHYIPFYIMGRVLYIHHYEPALYFAIMNAGFVIDYMTGRLPRKFRLGIYSTLMLLLMATFAYFSAFTFGIRGPSREYKHLNWDRRWNVYDE